MAREVPERDLRALRAALPSLAAQFPTYASYATASVSQVLGPVFSALNQPGLEAATLSSFVFMNRGDHFEARPLPDIAQFAPVFGIVAADFDGDTHEDIFLSQNFFAVQPTISRNDAGVGLLLLGDGKGGAYSTAPCRERHRGLRRTTGGGGGGFRSRWTSGSRDHSERCAHPSVPKQEQPAGAAHSFARILPRIRRASAPAFACGRPIDGAARVKSSAAAVTGLRTPRLWSSRKKTAPRRSKFAGPAAR